jgi:predicted AAA+ superfamily ATPase
MKRVSGSPAPEERGALFEGLVAQLIRAYGDYRNLCDEFFYWGIAGQRQTEVDFLLKRGEDFVAIEVKSGNTFAEAWCKGLRALAGLKGLRRRMVVYPEGPELQTADGIEIFSFSRFSNLLAEDAVWI